MVRGDASICGMWWKAGNAMAEGWRMTRLILVRGKVGRMCGRRALDSYGHMKNRTANRPCVVSGSDYITGGMRAHRANPLVEMM